jgi:hypothetical protein
MSAYPASVGTTASQQSSHTITKEHKVIVSNAAEAAAPGGTKRRQGIF